MPENGERPFTSPIPTIAAGSKGAEAGNHEGKTAVRGRCLSGDGWFTFFQEDVVYL
jgi:hypothetical protein